MAQTSTGEAARRLKTRTEETGIEAESPGAWWNTLRCQQPSALFTLNHFCGSYKITAGIGCFCLMHPHKYFHRWKFFADGQWVLLAGLFRTFDVNYQSWNSKKPLPCCTRSDSSRQGGCKFQRHMSVGGSKVMNYKAPCGVAALNTPGYKSEAVQFFSQKTLLNTLGPTISSIQGSP